MQTLILKYERVKHVEAKAGVMSCELEPVGSRQAKLTGSASTSCKIYVAYDTSMIKAGSMAAP
jgi:hypothetical protein